jgi:hypothetical protein
MKKGIDWEYIVMLIALVLTAMIPLICAAFKSGGAR